MTPPLWLQELRDVLAATDYEDRRAALQHWERRWLLDVHWRYLVSKAEMRRGASQEILARLGRQGQHAIGEALAKAMTVVTYETCGVTETWPGTAMEIRADAWAIRQEPKTDA